jgi:hypothetical protein
MIHSFNAPQQKEDKNPMSAFKASREMPPAQTATNGSRILPRVLNPGPLPLGPGIETRHPNHSQKHPT